MSTVAHIAETHMKPLLIENIDLVEQLASLLCNVSNSQYRHRCEELGCGSIGEHVRHLCDHYTSLMTDSPPIDYDRRQRFTPAERSPADGQQRLASIAHALTAWTQHGPGGENTIHVSYRADSASQATPLKLPSTPARELTFVANHTLHHMALIGILARRVGIPTPDNFGVARSTRDYHQQASALQQRATPS